MAVNPSTNRNHINFICLSPGKHCSEEAPEAESLERNAFCETEASRMGGCHEIPFLYCQIGGTPNRIEDQTQLGL